MEDKPLKIPNHIAIIMDGNGRWAKARNMPAALGHREGAKAVDKISRTCQGLGVKILTLYAFSTENWKRDKNEVNSILELLNTYLDKKLDELMQDEVKLSVIGDISAFPEKTRTRLERTLDKTAKNKKFTLCLALNYGARSEILKAVKKISEDAAKGVINIEKLDEKKFSEYLYTKGMPDPDLLIRTSGEIRLSNFLLWQLSYAEFYFTDKLWPDFGPMDLKEAIQAYTRRERRFGGR